MPFTHTRCSADVGRTGTPSSLLPPHEIIGAADAPVIVVLGGISAHRHVAATTPDLRPGWWDAIVGPARAIDTTSCRVLSFDYADGGATTTGRPRRIVTTHDQAASLLSLLDALAIDRVSAIVGSSYGGMVALAFAERYAARVERLVVISAAHEPHPMITGLRSIQRQIVELGLDSGRTDEALTLARAVGMTTYRSIDEFIRRFDVAPASVVDGTASFPVDAYLRHQGRKFAQTWEPARFLALSLSCDLHRVDPGRVRVPATIVAAQSDAVVPRQQLDALSRQLGAPNRLVPLDTIHGHDAFLAEPAKIGSIVRHALTRSIDS